MSKENNTNGKKVVLIVDDDIIILNLYERMFKNKGMDVHVAKDGEEGLEMIRKEHPDFVVLDIRMPKLDGIEVLKKVREDEEFKDTPILMLTNFDLREYREEVEKLGAVDFLIKTGIKPSEIVKRVVDFFLVR